MNNNQRQSRWGAAPPHQQAPIVGNNGEEPRDRSQSQNDPRRGGRGYDTTDAPSHFNRDGQRGPPRDESRGDRWGGAVGDRRNSRGEDYHAGGGGRLSYDNERHPRNGRGEEDMKGPEERDQQYGRGDEGWRCMECDLFNDPRDERCPRCRTWKVSPRRSMDDNGDRYHRNSDREGRGDGDGHYGLPSRGSRRGRDDDDDNYDDDIDRQRFRKKSRDETSNKREWPPHFESSGASFIFDARSGMFYEPSSDFFYDPKTKLYYGNKKQRYFRYDAEKKPCAFQPVGEENNGHQNGQVGGGMITSQVVTAAEENAAEQAPPEPSADADAKTDKLELKPKIAISIKTALPQKKEISAKSLKDVAATEKNKRKEKNIQRKESALSAAVESNAAPAALPQSHKNHAKDMNKWSERVKEMRDEDTSEAPAAKKVKTTVSGQPICVLCRRKFPTLEKLVQHEKLSALHKENLAKKAAADAAAKDAAKQKEKSDASYRDRSKERRKMYGSHAGATESSSHAEALLAHSLGTGSSSQSKPAEVIRPEETLNDANVGNKLLQKLGWKSGEALGRNCGKQGTMGNDGAVASNLKSDWERIESLAQRGGGRR